MYPKIKLSLRKTSLKVNKSTEGETMEMKVTRLFANNQTTTDGAPLIYTEKKDRVLPGYDIRHDKWETATEAMDKYNNPQPYQNAAKIKKAAEAAQAEKAEAKKSGDPSQHTTATNNNQ